MGLTRLSFIEIKTSSFCFDFLSPVFSLESFAFFLGKIFEVQFHGSGHRTATHSSRGGNRVIKRVSTRERDKLRPARVASAGSNVVFSSHFDATWRRGLLASSLGWNPAIHLIESNLAQFGFGLLMWDSTFWTTTWCDASSHHRRRYLTTSYVRSSQALGSWCL